MRYYLPLIIIISLLTYAAYAYDKRCAIKHQERVPEKTLLLLAFIGGAPGALLAMKVKHHKTRKLKFRICVPLFLIMQIAIFIYYVITHYPSLF